MVFDKISTISSYLTDEVPLWNTYRQTRYGSVSEITYQNYIKLNSLYADYKSCELDENTKFVIGAAIYVLYEYGFEFNSFYEFLDEGTEKKEKDEFSHLNIGTENKWELKDCLEKFIKANFPKIDSGDSYEISKVALFNTLEKLNWNLKNDDDYNFDYKNRQLQTIKNQIRPIFLFYFYRSSDNFEKFFWTDLNNLLVNEFSLKNRRNFFGESVERKYLEDYEFLDERFDKNECLGLISLFYRHNEKDRSSLKSEKYIEEISVLEKALKGFFQNETEFSDYEFEKLFKMLHPKLDEHPGFCALLIYFMGNLSYSKLEEYFPAKNKKAWRDDVNIYLELEKESSNDESEKNESWFERRFKATLPERAVIQDVGKFRENLSNERIVLLTRFFFFATYKLINENTSAVLENEEAFAKWNEIKRSFLTFCKNGEWKTEECLKKILNDLAALCKIRKENPFSEIAFSSLNKSSFFESNKALLVSFFNLLQFAKIGKKAALDQLDFIDSYKEQLIPLSENYVPDENSEKLKNLDCGFGEFLYQQMPFKGVFYPRPMKFKLWQDSDRKFVNFSEEFKKIEKKRGTQLTKEQRNEEINKLKNDISRKINSNNLTGHYFYSVDRNMINHFSIHKSISFILSNSEKLIYALRDIKKYFKDLEKGNYVTKHSRFLRKKFERLCTNINFGYAEDLIDDKTDLIPKFDLKEKFGREFYDSVQDFFEVMYVSDENLINEESFGLWIYMLYLTFSLASEDSEKTIEEKCEFDISDSELEKAKSFFGEEYYDKDTIAYLLFFYQLRTILESKNMEQWEALPVSVIMKLHNGDFDSIPEYVKNMKGIVEEAKLLFKYKKQAAKNPDFSEAARVEWKETSKELRLNKTLSDFSFNESNSYYKVDNATEEKIIVVNGIRQKVFSNKYRNFKVELSAVLNEETDEFEIYLGKKTSASQVPVFSFTRFRQYIQSENFMPSFGVLNKIEIDKTIISLIDNFIKSFVENYFSKVDFIKIEETATEETVTFEELSNKITEFEKNRQTKIQNEIDKIWNERKSKNDYEIHNEKLDELYDKQGFRLDSYFWNGNESYESFINLSFSNYPNGFDFQLVLSEDKKTILVFKDKSGGDSFKENKPLFTIPVFAYETLCDFSFEFLKALYDEKNEINYDSEIPEMNEIKEAHFNYLQGEYQNLLEYKKNQIENSYSYNFNNPWNRLSSDEKSKKPQDELDDLALNINSAIESKLRNAEWHLDSIENDIRTMKEKGEKYKIEGYKLNISSYFENENENQNFASSIGNFVFISPTADGSSLNMKLLKDNYWDSENCDDSDIISTVKVPACQYRKIFVFERKLRDYWEKNHKSYYIEIEHTNDFGGTWIEKKNNFDEQKRVFEEVASQVFDSEYDSSVKFTPLEFYKTMNFLEIKKSTPYCFIEKKEVNGIKQILLSTGLELFNFTFALIPVNFNTEIEVCFESKKSESDKPLFKFDKNCVDSILKFLGGIVYRQLEIVNAQ